jgi:RNA polymerase sigma-70 factor (ECF subfamily)
VADPGSVVERVARESYGRLVAYLSVRTGDVAGAEDALADAFVAALRTWPRDGVPSRPEAWLLTAARRRIIDRVRQLRVREQAAPMLRLAVSEATAMPGPSFPDERLKLLFVCAHPAIDAAMHTPLMLQVVLGLDAATIARAFLIPPATMGQRLSRAKTKIRDAGIRFDVPDLDRLPQRLDAVLEAIYAAYGSAWDDVAGADVRGQTLIDEAIWLARLVIDLLPDEPEARGLLALMLYCEARRPARRTATGAFVPMTRQDPARWAPAPIAEAERELAIAGSCGRPGRFQLEAALQSAHVDGVRRGAANPTAIAVLYEGLVRIAPTVGALVGRAAAVADVHGALAGLACLDAIAEPVSLGYQPYWAVRAHLLSRLDRVTEATEAFDRAAALTIDPSIKAFLLDQRADAAGRTTV